MLLQHYVIELALMSRPLPLKLSFVSVDAARAFDRLPISVIVGCLRERGAPPYLTNIAGDWLHGRRAFVRVGHTLSPPLDITSGCPQGSITGPAFFNAAADTISSLQLSAGTRMLLYADDILLIRPTGTLADEAALQEDIDSVTAGLAAIGLAANPKKSKLLNVSANGRHALLTKPKLGGQELEVVETLRYLGTTLDSRLSFTQHWTKVSTSAKRAMGALARLVSRNKTALRYLFQERAVSVFLHSLPYSPPTTAASWHKLNGVGRFVGHLLLNRWDVHGPEVLRLAELPTAQWLCYKYSLRYFFACVRKGRRFGLWLESEEIPERRRELRSQELRHPLRLREPQLRLELLRRLGPARLLRLWNSLPFAEAGLDPQAAFASLSAFDAALPALHAHIPNADTLY